MTIFVSIASYRDVELPLTINSLIQNADVPQNLHIGIVDQSTNSESIDISNYKNTKSLWMHPRDARGAGYARAQAQTMYDNEDWFLQIDSHSRFEQGWDTKLIDMYSAASSAAGNPKIILSQFPKAYIREGNEDIAIHSVKYPDDPHRQIVYWFRESVWSGFRIPFDDPRFCVPEESETILAGFVFAPGSIVNEVPYDPDICFWGEELAFSLRAWTRGWQIYSPNEMVISHFYERKGHNKIWDSRNNVDKKWALIENNSVMRQHQVYTGELTGVWGAKNLSSLADYYDFIQQDVGQKYTEYLQRQKILDNKQVESDIFAGMVMPSLSPLCIKQTHKECSNKQCECPCHSI